MATAAHDIATTRVYRAGAGAFAAPVIADSGDEAWVVLVRSSAPLRPGSTFAFAGLDWEVVRAADHLRGFVAWPRMRSLAAV